MVAHRGQPHGLGFPQRPAIYLKLATTLVVAPQGVSRFSTASEAVGAFLIQLEKERVDHAGVLEPVGVQADGGDPGRRDTNHPVAVELPGMPGDP
jgi:hypothetical protein